MIDGIGGRPVDPGLAPALGEDLVDAGEAPLEALFAAVDELDEASRAEAARADRDALEEALARPPAEHRKIPIDLGRITAALARATRERPGDGPRARQLRKTAAKYLALRLEVAAGMARITVG